MKKRKIKLFASVASLAMVAAVMGVGVWAATSQAVTVNSTISFSATGLVGNITLNSVDGTAAKAAKIGGIDYYDHEGAGAQIIAFDANTTDVNRDAVTVAVELNDNDNDGFFGIADTTETDEQHVAFTYTFTISNTSTDINMYYDVAIQDNDGEDAWTAVAATDGTFKTAAIIPSDTDEITVTFYYEGADLATLQGTPSIPSIKFELKTYAQATTAGWNPVAPQ